MYDFINLMAKHMYDIVINFLYLNKVHCICLGTQEVRKTQGK